MLQGSSATTLSMRAGVVIGAGSTSFEIIRQTAQTLLVQPVPRWMRSDVQPIAVADVVRVLADALEGDASGDVDIAGPDVISYPDLLALYADVADLSRVQVPLYGASVDLVALTAGLVSAAPYWTAAALVRSLQHDMVCRPGQPDPAKVDLTDALPLREAMEQAVLADGPSGRASGRVESDPAWVKSSWVERSIRATRLPGSTLLSLRRPRRRAPGPRCARPPRHPPLTNEPARTLQIGPRVPMLPWTGTGGFTLFPGVRDPEPAHCAVDFIQPAVSIHADTHVPRTVLSMLGDTASTVVGVCVPSGYARPPAPWPSPSSWPACWCGC